MMEKPTQLNLKFPQQRTFDIEVTFTDAACVVVHPTVVWELLESNPKILDNDWSISQYPTGLRLFDGIPSKEGAIECANRFLAIKHFVGMSVSEFYNDFRASAMSSEDVNIGEKAVVNAYQFILELRSKI